MINRRAIFLLAMSFAATATWVQHAEAAQTSVRIRGVNVAAFPKVTVTGSVVGGAVSAGDIRVTEDGRPVSDATVTPLSQNVQEVDVVLAIDTSNSMRGQALASAIAAALKFVTSLPTDQTVRVGIIEFASKPRVVQPLTDDRSALLTKLGSLSTKQGTALYDAVRAASSMFAGPGQRNIVLLTDGGDRSSTASLRDAVAAAQGAHAAIFAVGLKTHDTDVHALQTLAKDTKGLYSPAGTANLASVYTSLADQLSHQFVVTYTSTHKSGGQVQVGLSALGSSDSAVVLEPKIVAPPAPEAPASPPAKPFLRGQTGLYVVVALGFLAMFMLLWMLLGARARRRSDQDLVRRVAQTPETSEDAAVTGDKERTLANWIPEPVVQAGERVAEAAGFGGKLALMLERGGLPLRPGEYVASIAMAGAVGMLVGGLLLHNPIFMLLIGGGATALPIVYTKIKVKKRSQKLHGQLADILMILASSLRAGHGFFQALDLVAKEIGEPGSQEFGRVVAEVRLGRPVDEALNAMAERIGSDDFKWAVLGVNIQREVGGNLAEILDTIADTVRERDAVRRQVQVLSSEGRLSIGILAALPFFVSLYIAKVNPGYMNLLFPTRIGLIMVVTAVCLLGVGIFWMRKIVNIDV